ncbi:FUSC family protein [Weissella minor]|uniref:FUSC family protein n=1 Tax=Weissella minor TaxID=1620 RepID=UPI001BB02E97|nr:aromatic acid exporter family protein [Weissella minor]MBS0949689.1 FUSC family protein [Weissella minor]
MQTPQLQFRFGLRTLKTGISVMILVIIFLLLDRGNPMIACLSAVFSLRQDFETTIQFGKSRVIANAFGGAFAMVYSLSLMATNHAYWVQILVLPFLLMMLIATNDAINNNSGIIGASAAFLMICFTIPADGDYLYAVARVIDTFIGMAVAILMNVGVHPIHFEEPLKAEVEAIHEKIVEEIEHKD